MLDCHLFGAVATLIGGWRTGLIYRKAGGDGKKRLHAQDGGVAGELTGTTGRAGPAAARRASQAGSETERSRSAAMPRAQR